MSESAAREFLPDHVDLYASLGKASASGRSEAGAGGHHLRARGGANLLGQPYEADKFGQYLLYEHRTRNFLGQ